MNYQRNIRILLISIMAIVARISYVDGVRSEKEIFQIEKEFAKHYPGTEYTNTTIERQRQYRLTHSIANTEHFRNEICRACFAKKPTSIKNIISLMNLFTITSEPKSLKHYANLKGYSSLGECTAWFHPYDPKNVWIKYKDEGNLIIRLVAAIKCITPESYFVESVDSRCVYAIKLDPNAPYLGQLHYEVCEPWILHDPRSKNEEELESFDNEDFMEQTLKYKKLN